MKLKFMILANIILYLSLIPSCTAPEETPPCDTGTNVNIKHICINKIIDKKEHVNLDMNGDGNPELTISYDKTLIDGKTIGSNATLSLINLNSAYPRFDLTGKLEGGSFIPLEMNFNTFVDSSLSTWVLKIDLLATYVGLFNYFDGRTGQNPNLLLQEGIIDKGDVYIGLRYYETEIGEEGWKNGWIKVNATKDKLIIYELAYEKRSETRIKIGEK